MKLKNKNTAIINIKNIKKKKIINKISFNFLCVEKKR